LILRTLKKDALHGWAVSERIQQISQDVLQINQGSLYPALHRLEHQGWIEAEGKVSGSAAAPSTTISPRRAAVVDRLDDVPTPPAATQTQPAASPWSR
jgi:hypothetical protein